MPVTQSIWQASDQAGGGQNVVETHYYNDIVVAGPFQWYAAPGMNVQAIVDARVAQINEQLAQAEYERIVGAG